MDDKDKKFVDALLQASLRNYAAEAPRPGLEGRILAGVRARQHPARRRAVWSWAAAIAGATAIVALAVVHAGRRQSSPLPLRTGSGAHVSAPVPAMAAPQVQVAASRPAPHIVPRRATRPWTDPRPQQFPTPRPLSEQEKLLVVYAQSLEGSSAAPAADSNQDAEQKLEVPPLTIAAIKIEPLPPPKELGDQ